MTLSVLGKMLNAAYAIREGLSRERMSVTHHEDGVTEQT